MGIVTEINNACVRLQEDGFTPTTVLLGWREYGQLYRLMHHDVPDSPQLHRVYGLLVGMLPEESCVRVIGARAVQG